MKIEMIKGGVCAVKGVRAYGIKEGKNGLAVIEGRGEAAGVFTSNKLSAAPVVFTKKQLERGKGRIGAIIANSGCANSFTGEHGVKNAQEMSSLVGLALGISADEVCVASTGPIGVQLNMELIRKQVEEVVKGKTSSKEGSTAAAKAIMTTDTFHKEAAVSIGIGGEKKDGRINIGGIAKGSGMIFPHLATMLCFIYTDADLSAESRGRILKDVVDTTFNMVVVDGDMSTNDMVLLVSTGKRGKIKERDFKTGLNFVCEELAKMIARDGEGSTKFIAVRVKGASSVDDVRGIAKAIVRSPLVKSSVFGESPNLTCGRIMAAIGSCSSSVSEDVNIDFDANKISISLRSEIGDRVAMVVRRGKFVDSNMDIARNVMKGKEIVIEVDMGIGGEEATAWGCDLSPDYVRLNVT